MNEITQELAAEMANLLEETTPCGLPNDFWERRWDILNRARGRTVRRITEVEEMADFLSSMLEKPQDGVRVRLKEERILYPTSIAKIVKEVEFAGVSWIIHMVPDRGPVVLNHCEYLEISEPAREEKLRRVTDRDEMERILRSGNWARLRIKSRMNDWLLGKREFYPVVRVNQLSAVLFEVVQKYGSLHFPYPLLLSDIEYIELEAE